MKIDTILPMLKENSFKLSDMVRAAIYNKNRGLFDLLDFSDDNIFLEPTLFCYFLSDIPHKSKISLEQCLWGYIHSDRRPQNLQVKSDVFGLVNIPNVGYLKLAPNGISCLDIGYIEEQIIPKKYISNSGICLCLHPTEHLNYQVENLRYYESVRDSLERHQHELESAVDFFKNQMSCFWEQVEKVTREFVVFSSPDYNSFAGIMQHGTAYFNVENKQKSKVFFIDDIAHQCGHIIFNTLTYEIKNYLKVPKDYLIKNFSPNPQERRGVYGALHGLFTYLSILWALDIFLEKESYLDKILEHEAIGRLGFYLHKFKHDLELMEKANIFTDAGLELYEEFGMNFMFIQDKWKGKIEIFNYMNQPYIFQYDNFKESNPIL
jgi:hypothetical protein